jgi:hypothetical protein
MDFEAAGTKERYNSLSLMNGKKKHIITLKSTRRE